MVSMIQLQPSNFPGYNSPVAIAVNTDSTSPKYGYAYVVGSVAGTISEIDLSHLVINEIPVGIRPEHISFNAKNGMLYVSNLVSNSVSVIDCLTATVSTTLAVGKAPRATGINPENGDVYVVNSGDNNISVFDKTNVFINTIGNVGLSPVNITYHPVNKEMYVVSATSNNVIPVDTLTYTALPDIVVGNQPYGITYNSNNGYLYVLNRNDNTISIIAPDKSIRASIHTGNVNIGVALNQSDNILYVSDTSNNTVNVIGYLEQSSSIIVDNDYAETNRDIKTNPVILKHAKFVVNGNPDVAKTLTVKNETPTGIVQSSKVSFTNYSSPQNYLMVAEIFDIDGAVIDGKTLWEFAISGNQTVSLLLYYKQVKMQYFMAERTAPVTDNGMSKGVPKQWLQTSKDKSEYKLKI
jgi:YVTN family beta-propeller protein